MARPKLVTASYEDGYKAGRAAAEIEVARLRELAVAMRSALIPFAPHEMGNLICDIIEDGAAKARFQSLIDSIGALLIIADSRLGKKE